MDKVELLAPAGDLKKLKIAVMYGADAVYFGGESFSLRAGADNFSLDEMKEGLEFAHARGVKCYLALNIYAHNEDIEPLREYLQQIKELALDAFIAADPAVIDMIREAIPKAKIHLSTQANMTNYMTAMFWYRQGIRRLVLARELSLAEIAEIRANTPADLALEAFVHGAMCISYSGRCLLSNFMIERDANRGQCAHPCRWKYALVEQQRPGEYYPLEEDERGSYILNSKDLCMIEHIPELIAAGVTSFKIEGRMKSVFTWRPSLRPTGRRSTAIWRILKAGALSRRGWRSSARPVTANLRPVFTFTSPTITVRTTAPASTRATIPFWPWSEATTARRGWRS